MMFIDINVTLMTCTFLHSKVLDTFTCVNVTTYFTKILFQASFLLDGEIQLEGTMTKCKSYWLECERVARLINFLFKSTMAQWYLKIIL